MGTSSPRGITGVGVFLFFGTAMATLAGTLLIHPGTILDRAWVLNPVAHGELARFGKPIGIVSLLLGALLAAAATGWCRRRYWGWLLTVVIVMTQVAGDLINFIRGDHLRGGVGFAIAVALGGRVCGRGRLEAIWDRARTWIRPRSTPDSATKRKRSLYSIVRMHSATCG